MFLPLSEWLIFSYFCPIRKCSKYSLSLTFGWECTPTLTLSRTHFSFEQIMKIISDLVNIKKYQFSRSLITITRSKMKNSKKQPFLTKFDIFHANWTKINNTGFLGLLITILRSKMKNSIWQPFFGLKSTLFVQIAQK